MAGYSGKNLAQKLGIKDGMKLMLMNAPKNYFDMLEDLPSKVKRLKGDKEEADFIHAFVKTSAQLKKNLPALLKQLNQDGMIWISWYKKSSGMQTDVTEDTIRAVALPIGLVDVKVCAVDDQWSGLKLVIRKENRTKK